MKNKFLLLLGANQFQRERSLIGAEKAFDGKVLTVSPVAPFHSNKYPSTTIQSNEMNPEILLQDVIKFVEKTKCFPAAVVPLNDFVLNAGYLIASHFGLLFNSNTTLKNCRTKDLMKSVLHGAGMPVVQSYRFNKLNEARGIALKIGYPLVIKPLNFGGSGGVIKVDSSDQLEHAIKQTQDHLAKFAGHYDSDTTTILIEPYIAIKREVSIEVINTPNFRSVIGITDKFLSSEPYFSEVAHLVPSSLTENENISNKLKKIALNACKALGIEYGMAHVEMKVGEDGSCVIIEVGVRTAGDGIMDLYEKATGKNIYELHCKAFLGKLTKEELPKEFQNAAAIGYMHPENGIIDKINIESLNSVDLENIDLVTIRTQIGEKVVSAKDWSTRYGFIEYTLIDNPSATGFDLIKQTSKIANKIFSIKRVSK
jgi:carbamoylphosphate synthase large subunit